MILKYVFLFSLLIVAGGSILYLNIKNLYNLSIWLYRYFLINRKPKKQ